jgi:hypothetical protein
VAAVIDTFAKSQKPSDATTKQVNQIRTVNELYEVIVGPRDEPKAAGIVMKLFDTLGNKDAKGVLDAAATDLAPA